MYGSDEEIVEAILRGETRCFEEIVNRYKRAVYSLCLRMIGNRTEAEDLAQEVFIKAYNALPKYNPSYKLSTWILKIATNTSIDYLRKRRPEQVPLEEEIASNQETASAEGVFFHRQNQHFIEEAILKLPIEYRTLVVLYHHNGLSYKELAEQLDIPMSKVKNRLHRARGLLKEILKEVKEEESQWTAKQLQV